MTKAEQLRKNFTKKEKPKRLKKCHYCKDRVIPYGDMRTFCFKNECIEAHNKKTSTQKHKKAKKEFNENDTEWLLKEAQKVFNKYIRKRDEMLPCVSCGYVFTYLDGEKCESGRQRQAGHLKTEAKNALLRFNEDNVHSQCNHCNDPFYGLKGNVGEYEKNLRVRIGDDRVDKLFVPKVVKKWTIEELKGIIDTYKQKVKEIG